MFQEVRRALLSSTQRQGASSAKKFGESAGPADASQMFAEIAAKSSYQAQIAADVVKYTDRIEALTKEIRAFRARDMGHLDDFVERVDTALDQLTDQAAVLRNFEWPEVRFDTFREAVGLHKELEQKKQKFRQWQTGNMGRVAEMKRMQQHMVSCAKAHCEECTFKGPAGQIAGICAVSQMR